jgi:hypothetical protein
MCGEAAGEVGEEVGEDLSFASLGAENLGQHDPLRTAIHEWMLEHSAGKRLAQDTLSLARRWLGGACDELAKGVCDASSPAIRSQADRPP